MKKTEKVMAPVIWRWCRTVLDTETLPSINILSLINPLLKPGKPPGDPASYRPVALTELMVMVLEKVLQKVMQEHAEKKPSTMINILKSQQRILEERIKGKTVDNIFLDLSKAFDKVPTIQLIRRLKNCRFRG